MSQSLVRALDAEFRRVAKEEDITMERLIEEVSDLTGYSPRQLYNFRSGKWPVPSDIFPNLCRRFKSRHLFDLLRKEMDEAGIEALAPETCDIKTLAIEYLKEVTDHHYRIISAVKEGLDKQTLNELDEATERIVRQERILFFTIEAEYERARHGERKQA